MKELDEIMEGKHKINHLQIDGDTLSFNTELDSYTWNLSPRDIEIIIYCLQNELDKYKQVLDKIKEKIKTYPHISYASVEKIDGKRLSGQLIPVTEILEILEEIE